MEKLKNGWYGALQEQFVYMGVFTVIVYFVLKLDFAKQIFGPYIMVAGIVNTSIGYGSFLLGGIKTIKMLFRVGRAVEEVKKGEADIK